jgi:hypothetical protein
MSSGLMSLGANLVVLCFVSLYALLLQARTNLATVLIEAFAMSLKG